MTPPGLTWAYHSPDPHHRSPGRGPRSTAAHRHGSGSRLRAPPQDDSTTVRSPSGERRLLVSSLASGTAPPVSRRQLPRALTLIFG
jgi:hypothetical protein